MVNFRILKDYSRREEGEPRELGLHNWIRQEQNGYVIKPCHNQFSHSAFRSSLSFPQILFQRLPNGVFRNHGLKNYCLSVRKHHCVITKISVGVCIFPYSDRTQENHRQPKNKMLIVIADIFHCCSLLQNRVLEYFTKRLKLKKKKKYSIFCATKIKKLPPF
jgi:hypothetical protein